MKIVLATGIYPPDIGGPATYVRALAEELSRLGNDVMVVTYGTINSQPSTLNHQDWRIVIVPRGGGPPLRWWRYARALREVAADADVVEAFSSVSVGVPLMFARLKKPKKVLRLGGDFFWERYTDHGGMLGLQEWYERRSFVTSLLRYLAQRILSAFDHVVFSTEFQKALYRKHYRLPMHSVIENALPVGTQMLHASHAPFRLLFMGRFVQFKNLPLLLRTLTFLPQCSLTLVGSGPMEHPLRSLVRELRLADRVEFVPAQSGEDKARVFAAHDLLVLPSITELSPNVALEARVAGLPVLLTRTTGLGEMLTRSMVIRDIKTPEQLAQTIADVRSRYGELSHVAALPPPRRGWEDVAREHLSLFSSP